MFHKRYLIGLGASLLAAVVATAAAFGGHTASRSGGVTILAKDGGLTIAANKYLQDNMAFAPGTVTVKSGDTITFKFSDAMSMDPHTLTIVKKSDLPTNGAGVQNCKVCFATMAQHLKNPKGQPGPSNPISHWVVNQGQPGLDAPGDSVAIQEHGAHKSAAVTVSAPAGTTLYFLCAYHPWMQGKIIVK